MCCFVTPVQVNLSAYCYVCSGLFISMLLCLFRSVYQCAVIFVQVSLSSLLLRSVYQYAVKFVQVSLSVCCFVQVSLSACNIGSGQFYQHVVMFIQVSLSACCNVCSGQFISM